MLQRLDRQRELRYLLINGCVPMSAMGPGPDDVFLFHDRGALKIINASNGFIDLGGRGHLGPAEGVVLDDGMEFCVGDLKYSVEYFR